MTGSGYTRQHSHEHGRNELYQAIAALETPQNSSTDQASQNLKMIQQQQLLNVKI
jgi:hypothetical protein